MTGLRADGFGGQIEFDGSVLQITRDGWRAGSHPPVAVPLADVTRVEFKAATAMTNGYMRLVVPGQTTKLRLNDPRHVGFAKKSNDSFVALNEVLQSALTDRGPLSDTRLSEIEDAYAEVKAVELEEKPAAARAASSELMRKAAGAVYAGHIVDYKGYRYGLGIKRAIAGASAEFESGADRSRPTLTRIGAGALLAGPVGAIAGGMFKKDRSKAYVTIVFPDGATVIIDGPAKDEKKMRQFANSVNGIARSEADRAAAENESEPSTVALSIPDQLLKLKELHGAGVLTDEEYELKSAPLIAAL